MGVPRALLAVQQLFPAVAMAKLEIQVDDHSVNANVQKNAKLFSSLRCTNAVHHFYCFLTPDTSSSDN